MSYYELKIFFNDSTIESIENICPEEMESLAKKLSHIQNQFVQINLTLYNTSKIKKIKVIPHRDSKYSG